MHLRNIYGVHMKIAVIFITERRPSSLTGSQKQKIFVMNIVRRNLLKVGNLS